MAASPSPLPIPAQVPCAGVPGVRSVDLVGQRGAGVGRRVSRTPCGPISNTSWSSRFPPAGGASICARTPADGGSRTHWPHVSLGQLGSQLVGGDMTEHAGQCAPSADRGPARERTCRRPPSHGLAHDRGQRGAITSPNAEQAWRTPVREPTSEDRPSFTASTNVRRNRNLLALAR